MKQRPLVCASAETKTFIQFMKLPKLEKNKHSFINHR